MNPTTPASKSLRLTDSPAMPARDPVRWILYSHLVCVGVCLAFTLADSSQLVNARVTEIFIMYFEILFLPGLLSLFACPLALLVVIVRGGLSRTTITISVIAEILLCLSQLQILLPMVSSY